MCKECNTSHLEINDEMTLWNVSGRYILKMKEWPEIDFGLNRILKLVM